MKVCEKPCSIIGWLWEGQFLRGDYVTVIISGADTPLPASEIHRPLSPFTPYTWVQVTMSQATHPQDLGWPSLQVALECPVAAVNLPSQYSKGIFISLPVKWKQWDRSEVLATDFSWTARRWLSGTGGRLPWVWNVCGVTSPSWQVLTAHVLLFVHHFLLLRLRWVTNRVIIAQDIDFCLFSLWKS